MTFVMLSDPQISSIKPFLLLSTLSSQISSFIVEGGDSEVVKGSTNEGIDKARAVLFT